MFFYKFILHRCLYWWCSRTSSWPLADLCAHTCIRCSRWLVVCLLLPSYLFWVVLFINFDYNTWQELWSSYGSSTLHFCCFWSTELCIFSTIVGRKKLS